MDDERRTNMTTALHQYRETVRQHNSHLLRILLQCMEEEPLPPQVPERAADQLRLQEISRMFNCAMPDSVTSPQDLLDDDLRAESVKYMDGVDPRPVSLRQREEYFAGIQQRIAEKNVEVAEFPPADLEYLCTLVSGVNGPGLPTQHWSRQIEFVSCLEEHGLESMLACGVVVPVPVRGDEVGDDSGNHPLDWVWVDWDIAVAFAIGFCNFDIGGSAVLYCRNKDNEQWKWRYGVYDNEWGSALYDSVEDFLGFYAHFRETTEEDVKKSFRSVTGVLRLR